DYIEKNKIKRFILITDNASFHVSKKAKQFIEKQSDWLTVIFLPKRSPNLNPVKTRVNRNLILITDCAPDFADAFKKNSS
ncbi:MAG: transposase, partial [Candidatus Nitrosopolaris sp.]